MEEVSATISKAEIASGEFLTGHFDMKKFRVDPQRVNVLGEDNDRGCRRTSLLLLVMWCS